MNTPTPQEVAFKQALRNHVVAAIPRGSGMTQAKLAAQANIGASTLSKAITAGSNYLPPADIARDIVTACLRHGPATVTAGEVETAVAAMERLRQAAKDADPAVHTGEESPPSTAPAAGHPGGRRWGTRYVTARVAVALASLALLLLAVVSVRVLSGSQEPGPELGLDLGRYCSSYGLAISGETCVAEVDLTKACNWERGRLDLKGVYRSEDPYSGECLTPDNRSVGGIREMTVSSCGKDYPDLPVTAIILNNHRWACSLKIDMNVACAWQYSRLDLTATKDSDNIWSCH